MFGNYTDDNTLYFTATSANVVISTLRNDFEIILGWFYVNCMVP